MNKHTFLGAALGLSLLAGSGLAAACELGPVQYNAAGERQVTVINPPGEQVGVTMQSPDGRWEAIIANQGAMNQRYSSPRAAAQAICEAAED